MFNPESPPEFTAARWFNANDSMTLAALKGRVVVVSVFQTHCQGCVRHALPQAQRLSQSFNSNQVQVIGLNSAFEEQDKQTAQAVQDFIANNGLMFPVAMDTPNGSDLPKTFADYEIQGTPTTLVFDRQGRLRRHYLGQVDDMRLSAEVMALCMEDVKATREASIAIEQRLALALTDPDAHHHHHDGECCGGHHHHGHDHDHAHDHAHGGGGCCGGAHDHSHDHAHAHAANDTGAPKSKAKGKDGCDGQGGCGCGH